MMKPSLNIGCYPMNGTVFTFSQAIFKWILNLIMHNFIRLKPGTASRGRLDSFRADILHSLPTQQSID